MGHSFVSFHIDSFHGGEVNYYATITHPESEAAVASSAYSHCQMLGLGKFESARDIGWDCASHDQCGMTVERSVED